MNEVMAFQNEQFGMVRTVMVDGEPWFCGKDILVALEYSANSDANKIFSNVPKQWKGTKRFRTLGGEQDMICLSEQGLYFFLGRSDKPRSLSYQMWIAGEVIPSIRKNGAYMTPSTIDDIIRNPENAVRLLTQLIEERKAKEAAEKKNEELRETVAIQNQQIAEMRPKVSYVDIVLACKDLLPLTHIAKDYGWSAKKLNQWLADQGVQFKQGRLWVLYQKYAVQGLTGSKTYTYQDKRGEDHSNQHTYWTQKGRLKIYEWMKAAGNLPIVEWEDAEDSEEPDVCDLQKDTLRIENEELKQRIEELEKQIPGRNARGAGRKPMDDKMRAELERFKNLRSEGKSRKQIQDIMGISQATYYRYKRTTV